MTLFSVIGGILVILFGLYQLGVFGESRILSAERRLPLSLDKMVMSPVTALLMGFVFSFAWTPCVGPTLAGVLVMTTTAGSGAEGFLLILVYTIGFIIPFLAAGLFTTTILGFFRKHRNVVRYTVKIGGILLILMGILMITGLFHSLSSVLSVVEGSDSSAAGSNAAVAEDVSVADRNPAEEDIAADTIDDVSAVEETVSEDVPEETESLTETNIPDTENEDNHSEQEETAPEVYPAPDFALTDQYGYLHRLSDYKGKVVFLNIWATWCPPCRAEMPDIQKLYTEFQEEGRDDVVILGVACPNHGGEQDEDGIIAFLTLNGYTYPTVMDPTGLVLTDYYITAYPTTYMIDADGNIYGYVTGSITEDIMRDIIDQTINRS